MKFYELLWIAIALSMDAFAASICKGISMLRFLPKRAALIAFFFGLFQAVMPLIGWLLGVQLSALIAGYDHWLAFVLLCFLGGKMLWEAHKNESCPRDTLQMKELLLLSFATSVDALAMGVTFAFLKASILFSSAIIGAVTFAVCYLGVYVGFRVSGKNNAKIKKRAELAGGLALIVIGLKILLEHLGFLRF